MSYDFKTGDTLVCIKNDGFDHILTVGAEYIVESIWWHEWKPHPRVLTSNADIAFGGRGFYADYFILKAEETLPEVQSTMYREEVCASREHILHVLDSRVYDQVLLIPEQIEDNVTSKASHIKLDPDDALNLAHDLVRMAMQIKRRTK